MQQAGEKSWTNATHLVITDEFQRLTGQHLTLAHLECKRSPGAGGVNEAGEIVAASSCPRAQLFVTARSRWQTVRR